MGTFNESKTRIRRFLRDPSAAIWSNEAIRHAFNAAQIEIMQKTFSLRTVNVWHWPPEFTYTYIHDWESAHVVGDSTRVLDYWQSGSMVISHRWEVSYWLDDSTEAEEGYAITLPWECGYATPNAPVRMPLHAQMDDPVFVAFDRKAIMPRSFREVAQADRNYRSRTGDVDCYYRPDQYQDEVVLYPRPSVVWQEYTAPDAFGDTGSIIAWNEGELDFSDTGIITDTVSPDDALLMVYDYLALDVSDDTATWDDAMEWPGFMTKYVEYATLERLYGADNDGFIPSLRDYWRLRKEIGIAALKRYQRMRLSDRMFRLGVSRPVSHSKLRFPSGYPAVNP